MGFLFHSANTLLNSYLYDVRCAWRRLARGLYLFVSTLALLSAAVKGIFEVGTRS